MKRGEMERAAAVAGERQPEPVCQCDWGTGSLWASQGQPGACNFLAQPPRPWRSRREFPRISQLPHLSNQGSKMYF